jgi:two-component system sensor histidine kinase/response regulator
MPKQQKLSTALIVEDSAVAREALAILLQQAGYRAVTADNGRQALDLLNGGTSFCVVLLDMMLPVLDGWTLLQKRQGLPPWSRVPFIAMAENGDHAWAIRCGADGIVRKPLDMAEVLAVMQRYCPVGRLVSKRKPCRKPSPGLGPVPHI